MKQQYLSAGITLEDLIDSLTKPGEQFQFPVKSIPVGLDKQTQATLLQAAGILGLSAIIIGAILKK